MSGRGPYSELVLEYHDHERLDGDYLARWMSLPRNTATWNAPWPAVPDEWPALAEEGETFSPGGSPDDGLTVEAGSRLAAPAFAGRCGTYSQVWVLAVNGDPDQVLGAYEQQLQRIDGIPESARETSVRRRHDGDAEVTSFRRQVGGPDNVTAQIVERRGEPRSLIIEFCDE